MAGISNHDEMADIDAQHEEQNTVTEKTGAKLLHQVLRNEETKTALEWERSMSVKDALKLYPKAVMFSVMFSLAVIMEGYDVSLLGNFYAFPAFKERYGNQVDATGGRIVSAEWQSILGNSVHVSRQIPPPLKEPSIADTYKHVGWPGYRSLPERVRYNQVWIP